jgi:hypothetical protein
MVKNSSFLLNDPLHPSDDQRGSDDDPGQDKKVPGEGVGIENAQIALGEHQ